MNHKSEIDNRVQNLETQVAELAANNIKQNDQITKLGAQTALLTLATQQLLNLLEQGN